MGSLTFLGSLPLEVLYGWRFGPIEVLCSFDLSQDGLTVLLRAARIPGCDGPSQNTFSGSLTEAAPVAIITNLLTLSTAIPWMKMGQQLQVPWGSHQRGPEMDHTQTM